MDISLAKEIANKLMQKHGLIKLGWTFEFNIAKRRFGVCKYGPKVIGLSRPLVELNHEERVKNTILHEIAHALVGHKNGHNEIWRAKAIEIGCDGERCYSAELVERPVGNYVATCKNGHVRYKYKRPTRILSCGTCSRSFDPNNVLFFQKV